MVLVVLRDELVHRVEVPLVDLTVEATNQGL
jgi:hypothetical protein